MQMRFLTLSVKNHAALFSHESAERNGWLKAIELGKLHYPSADEVRATLAKGENTKYTSNAT